MDMSIGDTQLILRECHARGVLRNQAAYILATARWETAHTMKPISERGSQEYLEGKPYYPYIGRGYVQLTWKENYARAGQYVGTDLVKDMRRAMDPDIAVTVLVLGMMEGWFTAYKLSDYVTLKRSDFHNARQVVNGNDKAAEIAAIARKYDAKLLAMGYGVENDRNPQETSKMLPIGLGGLVARYVLVAAAGAFASHIGWMDFNEAANTITIDLNEFDIGPLLGAVATGGAAVWWRKIAKAAGGKL